MKPCFGIALIWTIECREFSERLLSSRKNVYVSNAFSQTHKVERRKTKMRCKVDKRIAVSKNLFVWLTNKTREEGRKSLQFVEWMLCAFSEEDEEIDGNEEESWIDNLPRCRLLLIVSRCNDYNFSVLRNKQTWHSKFEDSDYATTRCYHFSRLCTQLTSRHSRDWISQEYVVNRWFMTMTRCICVFHVLPEAGALTSNCLMCLPLFEKQLIIPFECSRRQRGSIREFLCSRRAARGVAPPPTRPRHSPTPATSSSLLAASKWKFIAGSLSWILKAIEHHTIEHYWVEIFNDINSMFSLPSVMD